MWQKRDPTYGKKGLLSIDYFTCFTWEGNGPSDGGGDRTPHLFRVGQMAKLVSERVVRLVNRVPCKDLGRCEYTEPWARACERLETDGRCGEIESNSDMWEKRGVRHMGEMGLEREKKTCGECAVARGRTWARNRP